MLKVGITGGIGSGKTTVCKVFELLGIPVYYADEAARELMRTHPAILSGLKVIFGEEVFDSGGAPDRKKIATAAFADRDNLAKLNALVHPVVGEHFTGWVRERVGAPYILKEAAILFESGTFKQVDKIITVTAPVETRIARVMKRDNIPAGDVRKRLDSQLSDEEKISRSDFAIYNGDADLVIPQVLKVHELLMRFAKEN
jgi:dephospho-CoA kinase